jgi:hypothetical protein
VLQCGALSQGEIDLPNRKLGKLMRFQGKISHDGKTIDVTGDISKLGTTAGIISWAGYIDRPSGSPAIKIGDDAFLELDSGERGDIQIISYDLGLPGRVHFKSNRQFA